MYRDEVYKYWKKNEVISNNPTYIIIGIKQCMTLFTFMLNLSSKFNYVLQKALYDIINPIYIRVNKTLWRKYIAYLFKISKYSYLIPDIKNSNTNCQIITRINMDKQVIYDNICQFISEVSDRVIYNTKDKVKVYSISIARKITKTREKNPAYDDYNRRMEAIKLIGGELTGEILCNIPAEYVEIESVSKTVECREINEVYKSIDTMYLSQHDKSALTAIISNYRDNIEVLEKFGLPDRLGVMLYGAPGCGKSSTIVTIASEMRKDIY
jgi:hypothetical protein